MAGFRWLAEISVVVGGEGRETFHSDFCRRAYRHTPATLVNPGNFCPFCDVSPPLTFATAFSIAERHFSEFLQLARFSVTRPRNHEIIRIRRVYDPFSASPPSRIGSYHRLYPSSGSKDSPFYIRSIRARAWSALGLNF